MRLERLLARVLSWGTLGSSLAIAAGLALGDLRVVTAGILGFIALPVARVAIMVVVFGRARDARVAAIAALVLCVLVAGFLIGGAV